MSVSKERSFEVIRSPLVSEKSTFISQFNYYVFRVAINAKKNEIKNAVEQLFSVKVDKVRTSIQKGKNKKFKNIKGRRSDVKKAMVKLKEGNTIDTTMEIK